MVQPESKLDVVIIAPPTIEHQEEPVKLSSSKNQEKPSKPSIMVNINASYFRVCISLGGQALLWKTLSEKTDIPPNFHNLFTMLPSTAFVLLWCVALCVLVSLSILYAMRCIFYFNMVKAEFHHHVGVNYLFAPWISWLLLLQSAPSFIFRNKYSYEYVWWLLIIPVVGLDVKVYGQWFTTEKRFLSMVANPTSQLSVIGNFVGAHAAIKMGWRESGTCLFTLGLTHYMVVFITLYQRLSGSNHLPSRLRPVFFLFVATPSMAALAWKSINGSFDVQCKMLFFLSLFLFASLASRPMLFKKSMKEFSVAWWAFSFPLTFLALAATAYAHQVKCVVASGLAILLSAISVLVFIFLLVFSTLKIDSLFANPKSHLMY
ncbi:S-type anion channel SLAH1-like [Cynara cardunculus var. scolymus]|uniref:S-type anion channel SLAH1-like n=1 Tax=Cynara cardunculus var. scolymus TaxID=59895 RepID=UPI000D6249AC|nr:S-type anion channel SLAH1-like [Cynara cardunculus var. scolymus]